MHELTAREILDRDSLSFVSVKGDNIYTSSDNGIKPIMKKLLEDPSFLVGASVADVIIGKAAALLLIYGRASAVNTRVISEQAIEVFKKYDLSFEYDSCVPFVMNKDKTGMCPMEQTVKDISDPEAAFLALKAKLYK